ncbi:MAG: hypothetical protein JSW60_01275 [Thermoplasmatales archaeon]|nr:MAG: hypothetical protein JSW60_01275 [Thermoplasmatales archaeon]
MVKNRNISAHSDLKTGFFCKFFLLFGSILLIFYIIQLIVSLIDENLAGIILAFSILFLGLGIISYFFYCQFAKLAEIAEEVERGNESEIIEKNGK